MKLIIGEYVRTKYGKIGRIISFGNSVCFDLENAKGNIEDVAHREEMVVVDTHYNFEDEPDTYFCEDIIKSSPNIIDLIEVGDYVNGEKVYESRYGELYTAYVYCGGIGQRTTESYATFIDDMEEDDIESIVTKQQFEAMQYVVKVG